MTQILSVITHDYVLFASDNPQTRVQLCIVHMIRNSLRYVASKDMKGGRR